MGSDSDEQDPEEIEKSVDRSYNGSCMCVFLGLMFRLTQHGRGTEKEL